MTSRVGSLLATTLRDELSERASFGGQGTVEGSPEPTHCYTDASGRFEALKPPEKKFLVLVHAPRLPPWLELREAQPGDEVLDVRLAVPASISGRVLDPGGMPSGGARLELSFPEPRPRQEALTDEAGRFEFGGLGAGPFVMRLLERPAGTASCHVGGRIADGEHLQLDLELSEVSSITGTVAAEGGPLGGWKVHLWELADRDFPERDDRETRTASDGSFAFLGCSDKEYDLEFIDPDSPARRHRVTARAGRSPLTVEPRPSELVQFRGRIVVNGDAPRPSLLSIAAVRGSLVGRQTLVTIADESDEFLGPYLPRGTYNVDAFFPGSPAPWRKTLELDERESILAIPRRGSLRVELELPAEASFDGAAGYVRVRAPLATYWMHAPMRRNTGDEAFVAELMPGTYWVIVTLDDYAAEYAKAKVEEARETRLRMTPRKGTAVTIQVVAPRPLGTGEVLRLEVEETGRRVPVPFFRETPGESNTWWAGVELSANALRVVSFTPGGLSGELALSAELLQPNAVLRVELEERGSPPR